MGHTPNVQEMFRDNIILISNLYRPSITPDTAQGQRNIGQDCWSPLHVKQSTSVHIKHCKSPDITADLSNLPYMGFLEALQGTTGLYYQNRSLLNNQKSSQRVLSFVTISVRFESHLF